MTYFLSKGSLRNGLGYHHIGHSDDRKRVRKSYRRIAGIALAPEYFQLTSLAERQGLLSTLSISSEAYRYLNSLPLQSARQTGQKWTVYCRTESAYGLLFLKDGAQKEEAFLIFGDKENLVKLKRDLSTAPQCSYQVEHLTKMSTLQQQRVISGWSGCSSHKYLAMYTLRIKFYLWSPCVGLCCDCMYIIIMYSNTKKSVIIDSPSCFKPV